MSQRYRKIDPRMWRDESFRKLDHVGKLLAIYAFTAQSNRIGIFNFSPALAAEDLGIEPETLLEHFAKVCQVFDWQFDHVHRLLYIPTWWKYNPPQNPSVLKNCLNDLHDLPASPLITQFVRNVGHLPMHLRDILGDTTSAYGGARVPTRPPTRVPHQEQEQEQEQDQEQEQEQEQEKLLLAKKQKKKVQIGFDYEHGSFTNIDGKLEFFNTKFPSADIEAELRKMEAWLVANSNRRMLNYERFIVNWLNRSKDQPASNIGPVAPPGKYAKLGVVCYTDRKGAS